MNTIQSFFSDEIIHALGWTLIHSLWQGALAAIILATLLILMRRYSSTTRYLVSVLVLLLFFSSSIVSFVLNYSSSPTEVLATSSYISTNEEPVAIVDLEEEASNSTEEITIVANNPAETNEQSLGLLASLQGYFAQHIPLLVTLWLLGVLVLLLRFLGGLGYVQRLKHYKTSPLPQTWQDKAKIFEEKLGIRQGIQYLHSPIAQTPMVIGFIKPVVLLPAKILSGLSTQQIEAILIHELAHIKRHDYAVNLIQSLMEILFFFHPGAWWISSAIRNERENCCDDLAISLTGETTEYAKTLILLQEQQLQSGIPAVAFTGIRHSFSHRVKRLFNQPTRFADFKEGFVTALILIAGILALSFSSAKVFGTEVPMLSHSETAPPPTEVVENTKTVENTKIEQPIEESSQEVLETSTEETKEPTRIPEQVIKTEKIEFTTANKIVDDSQNTIPVIKIIAEDAESNWQTQSKDTQDTDDLTILLRAIDDGDIDIVRFILEKGVDVNGQTDKGWTPLLEAIDEDDANIVKLLLEKGADPNLKTHSSWSPLHEVADEGHEGITQLLLSAGADVNAKDKHGRTPLMVAVSEGHTAIMKILLDNGADIDQSYHNNKISPLLEAADEGHVDVAKMLLERGALVNSKGKGGWTPLIEAADEGHLEIVQLLLENGADVNAHDDHGWNALLHAVNEGHADIVELLIKQGMDVNTITRDKWTPLLEAADEGHLEIVEILLEKGAKVDAAANGGRTALMQAASEGHMHIVKKLLEAGATILNNGDDVTPLSEAAEEGHLEIVRLFIEKGADVDAANRDGRTALMQAADEGHYSIVEYLLSKGANVNARTKNGWTALMKAAGEGNHRIVQLLVDKGANVNNKANGNQTSIYTDYAIVHILKGWTALFEAVREEEEAVVKILLDNGANINEGIDKKINDMMNEKVSHHDGWSPLMEAVKTENLELVKLLVERGANPRHVTQGGMSVLDVAKETGEEDMVRYIKSIAK